MFSWGKLRPNLQSGCKGMCVGLLYPTTPDMPLHPVLKHSQAAWNPREKPSKGCKGSFWTIIMIVESESRCLWVQAIYQSWRSINSGLHHLICSSVLKFCVGHLHSLLWQWGTGYSWPKLWFNFNEARVGKTMACIVQLMSNHTQVNSKRNSCQLPWEALQMLESEVTEMSEINKRGM